MSQPDGRGWYWIPWWMALVFVVCAMFAGALIVRDSREWKAPTPEPASSTRPKDWRVYPGTVEPGPDRCWDGKGAGVYMWRWRVEGEGWVVWYSGVGNGLAGATALFVHDQHGTWRMCAPAQGEN